MKIDMSGCGKRGVNRGVRRVVKGGFSLWVRKVKMLRSTSVGYCDPLCLLEFTHHSMKDRESRACTWLIVRYGPLFFFI